MVEPCLENTSSVPSVKTATDTATETPIETATETATETPTETPTETATETATHLSDIVNRLMKHEITDANSAFNIIIGFVGLAQRRGAFAIDESAKIYECIKMFNPDQQA